MLNPFLFLFKNALLQETSEEWDQCERKIKDIRSWIEKTRTSLESSQHKKKPLRDQLGYCEKTVADINVQKTKLRLSIEKLEVSLSSTSFMRIIYFFFFVIGSLPFWHWW